MAIITISRGSFSHGEEIAEKVAERLGYECVSREILVEAAQLFNVSEKKLIKSLHDAPTILERITHGKTKYLENIKAALLGFARKGNMVYHGHAGHLLLSDIPNVLKVRLLAEKDDRISLLQKKRKLSREQAVVVIENEDKNRTNWTRYLYKLDLNDPWLYDVVVKIGGLTIEDVCEIICRAAQSESYITTPELQQRIDDLAIIHHIQSTLRSVCEADVFSKNGIVHVNVASQKVKKSGHISPALQHHIGEAYQHDLTRQINEIAHNIPGVREVFCNVDLPYYS